MPESEPKQRGPARRLLRLAVTIGLNVAMVAQIALMNISRAHIFWQSTGRLGISFFGWVDANGIWIVSSLSQEPWADHDLVATRDPTVEWASFYEQAGKGSIGDFWACWADVNGLHLVSRHFPTLIVILILQALHHRRLIARFVRW